MTADSASLAGINRRQGMSEITVDRELKLLRDIERLVIQREHLIKALEPFAEPHSFGDNYVRFAPRLIEAARTALAKACGEQP